MLRGLLPLSLAEETAGRRRHEEFRLLVLHVCPGRTLLRLGHPVLRAAAIETEIAGVQIA